MFVVLYPSPTNQSVFHIEFKHAYTEKTGESRDEAKRVSNARRDGSVPLQFLLLARGLLTISRFLRQSR